MFLIKLNFLLTKKAQDSFKLALGPFIKLKFQHKMSSDFARK